ncbi:hypothetical protein NQZ68_029199 [Dissostichus eleginoides]|nr:hypothetical protein NQZ68_029199 [Dissostichus eleginoides]
MERREERRRRYHLENLWEMEHQGAVVQAVFPGALRGDAVIRFHVKRLRHDRRETSSKTARAQSGDEREGRGGGDDDDDDDTQLISIRTDCQTRWGLLEKWGRVDGEGL